MESYKRITKPNARKMYNSGITIRLLPCKVGESVLTGVPNDFDWIKPVEISMFTSTDEINKFDRAVANYTYYNCNADLGYYPHYFVSEEDFNKYQMCEYMCQKGE